MQTTKELFREIYKDHHDTWRIVDEIEKSCKNCKDVSKESDKILLLWKDELANHFIYEEQNHAFPFIVKTKPELEPQIKKLLLEHDEIIKLILQLFNQRQNKKLLLDICKALKQHIQDEEKIFKQFYEDPYWDKTCVLEDNYHFMAYNKYKDGGKVKDLISQGVVELKMFPTNPEHAKEYGLDSVNPLYVQSLYVNENERLKGVGNKVLKYIDDYAIKNGHDVVFGHITQKAEFTKDNRETFFSDTDMIKNWLHSKGYSINNDNNDFHKIVNNDIRFKKGGSLSKTPAPNIDRIYGSDINKPKSAENKSSAKSIEFNESTIKSIKSIIDKHNEAYPKKQIDINTAKAVVRRGMGAYSVTHRPTITDGKPNSRVAWGLARLNAFVYKVQEGHSKSGKYKEDNDLINELGYKVQKFEDGGILNIVSTKSLIIKIGNDSYKIQYRKNERGDTEKKVWFAEVVSKNGKAIEDGHLCYDDNYTNVIYGFSLYDVEKDILDTFKKNDLHLITQNDYGIVEENRHIEFSNDSKNADIRYNDGGLIGNIFTKKIYTITFETPTDSMFHGTYENYEQAIDVFNKIDYRSLDEYSLVKGISKELRVVEYKYEFIGSIDEEYEQIEDYTDSYSLKDKSYWKLIDESDSEVLQSDIVESKNEKSDSVLQEVQEHFGGKYKTIYIDEDETISLKLRIADHSGKHKNKGSENYFLSIVISNHNVTENFYKNSPMGFKRNEEEVFDSSHSAKEIIDYINERINEYKEDEGIEPIKFKDGGKTDNNNTMNILEKYNINSNDIYQKYLIYSNSYQHPMTMVLKDFGVSEDDMVQAKKEFVQQFVFNLPTKIPTKKQRMKFDEQDILPVVNIDIKPLEVKAKPIKGNSIEAKVESLKDIVGTDDLRPSMQGVYLDAENGNIVGTDANKMIVITDSRIKETKLINPKTGKKIDEKYPNYLAVIPTSEQLPYKFEIDIDKAISMVNGIYRTSKFFGEPHEQMNFKVAIKVGDDLHFYNSEYFYEILSVFHNYGKETATISLKAPNRALLIENGDLLGLVMPLLIDVDYATYHIIAEYETTREDKEKDIIAEIVTIEKKINERTKKLNDEESWYDKKYQKNIINELEADLKIQKEKLAELNVEYSSETEKIRLLFNELMTKLATY